MNIVNVSVFENYDDELDKILKDATYSEICNYIEMLPNPQHKKLLEYGMDYMNQLYKMASNLFEQRQQETDIEEQIRLDNKMQVIYFAYCYTDYHSITLSFKEFITYSRILTLWFNDYNPSYRRDNDNIFHSKDKWIEELVNSVAYEVTHSPHPHAFEFDKTKLEILIGKLHEKLDNALADFVEKHHITEYEQLLDEAVIVHQEKERIVRYLKERKEENK